MCGAFESPSTPVIDIVEGLTLCTDCIAYIDNARDTQLSKKKRTSA